MKTEPESIDVIILSHTSSAAKQRMTEECITSLLASEPPAEIHFNIVVMESCKSFGGYQARLGRTIKPQSKFGFNRFLNIGLRETSAPFVALCNNDLIFHPKWATNLLGAMRANAQIESCCPYCGIYHPTRGRAFNAEPDFGYGFETLVGWCIFVKRTVLARIGPLDEKIKFWYAERDYGNLLEAGGISHALVSTARVDHLGSQTIKDCGTMEQSLLTGHQRLYFEYKWRHRSPLLYYWQLALHYPRLLVYVARSALSQRLKRS
jgi:GT2 family glycosyltransferase